MNNNLMKKSIHYCFWILFSISFETTAYVTLAFTPSNKFTLCKTVITKSKGRSFHHRNAKLPFQYGNDFLNYIDASEDSHGRDLFVMKATESEAESGDFWEQQKNLASSLRAKADEKELTARREKAEKFTKRRLALVFETLYFSIMIFSFLWIIAPTPATPISYSLGALLGVAYSYGLGKYVETIGGSVDNEEELQGAGVGQARFAFLILLFVFVGKFRSEGLQELPSIFGFFTYQLASLSQGLREIDD